MKRCVCRQKKQHYNVGELVQIRIGEEKYINGIVTHIDPRSDAMNSKNKRVIRKETVIVHYNTGKLDLKRRFMPKDLFYLNKNACPNV